MATDEQKSSLDIVSQKIILALPPKERVQALVAAAAEDVYGGVHILHQIWTKEQLAHLYQSTPEFVVGTFAQEVKKHNLVVDIRDYLTQIHKLATNGGSSHIQVVPLSSIEPEDVLWLWEPYIPYNKITLMEGDPGVGKTYLMLALTAAVTRGYALPDQQGKVARPNSQAIGNVLYLSAEDGLGDTIRPRAEKVGADITRFYVPLEAHQISLDQPEVLEQIIKDYTPRLVILDPLTAFLGAEMDMHRANEVRPRMSILGHIAREHSCAVVALRHWTKSPGGRARYRGQGNIDFTAAARSVLVVGESPEDDRLRIMAQSKNSLMSFGKSIVFQINEEGLSWAGTSEFTADDLSQMQPTKRQHQRKEAIDWLKDYLRDGPKPSQPLIESAKAVGIPERTLWRAKEMLGIVAAKDGKAWFWRLPKFGVWDRHAQEDDGESIEV